MKEYELVLAECRERFYEMARLTGTIWELFGGKASCNHGFGAIVGKLICESVWNMQGGETYEKFKKKTEKIRYRDNSCIAGLYSICVHANISVFLLNS